MTNGEREEMNQLCELIQTEKDHENFMLLVERLNELLSRHERQTDDGEPGSLL
jgi:hypothetical protein